MSRHSLLLAAIGGAVYGALLLTLFGAAMVQGISGSPVRAPAP